MSAAAEYAPPPEQPTTGAPPVDAPPDTPPGDPPVDPDRAEKIRQAALRRAYGGQEPVRAGDVVGQLAHLPERIRLAHEADGEPIERYDATPEEGLEYVRSVQRELMLERFRRQLVDDYSDFATADLRDVRQDQDPSGKIAAWVRGTSRTLLLLGDRGVGKTHLAVAVAAAAARGDLLWRVDPFSDRVVRRPATVVLWSEGDLVDATMPTAPGRDRVLADARNCDLLLLDDLGIARRSEWTLEMASKLIAKRNRNVARRTVYTTNLPLDENGFVDTPKGQKVHPNLEDKYDTRIVDRLVHDAVMLYVTGRTRRRPAPL